MALMLYISAAVVIMAGLFAGNPRYRGWLLIGGGGFVAALLAAMLLAPDTAERSVLSIFAKLSHFAESDYGRVFNAAYEAWQAHPVLGSGIHTYREVCEGMGVLAVSGIGCTHAHNLYLQLAAEMGLVGLLIFSVLAVMIYLAALRPLVSERKWYAASLSFSVLSVSFWPLTGGISVFNNWVAALVWLGVGWVLAISTTLRPEPYRLTKNADHPPG
jgi:O-antigen ligase